jgi:hypothetical protein
VSSHEFWLPDSALDNSSGANQYRLDLGLPLPPELPQARWREWYQLVEGAILRYRRALRSLPQGSPPRDRLESLWPSALEQLDLVTALCVRGARHERRRLPRSKRGNTRAETNATLAAITEAVERLGDTAAATAFNYALDAASTETYLVEVDDALAAVVAALDELNRTSFDP